MLKLSIIFGRCPLTYCEVSKDGNCLLKTKEFINTFKKKNLIYFLTFLKSKAGKYNKKNCFILSNEFYY